MERTMIGRTMGWAMVATVLGSSALPAQDVPGIEICTAEKTMERRTSCLQSNVEFLQKSLDKARLDQQHKLDAANRQIEALKAAVATLQKSLEQSQAAQKKPEPAAPAKDAAPAKPDAKPDTKSGAK
jgi:DNA repair exonuclease SbcCD ATPase subunit